MANRLTASGQVAKYRINVTSDQREQLQFLVNRRIQDIWFDASKRNRVVECEKTEEMITLRQLKKELDWANKI